MRRNSETGFTLIEVIVAMAITGVLAGMVALFARWPIQNYLDASNRAVLTDAADSALRRMSRDIHTALPNSLRLTTGTCSSGSGVCNFIEFIPVKAGGRYRTAQGSGVVGDPVLGGRALDLEATAAQTFDLVGPPLCQAAARECTVVSGDSLVIYNQGNNSYSNAYLNPTGTPKANRRSLTSLGNDLTALTIAGTGQGLCTSLPAPYYDGSTCAPDNAGATPHYYELTGFRFFIVAGAVSYECPSAANAGMTSLKRYSGYALQVAQPVAPPAGAIAATLASQLESCTLQLSPDNRQLSIGLTMTTNGESIHLLHQIDIYNAP